MKKVEETKICLVCHKPYQRKSREGFGDWEMRKFCSLSCGYIGRKSLKGRKFSLETIKKMRLVAKRRTTGRLFGDENPARRPEVRKKMRKPHFSIRGFNHPLFGKHRSIEVKRKISLTKGGTGIPHENDEYGAEFDDALKEQVRFRDGYKCQLCGCSQLENGRQLDCHHIDYDKENNAPKNLTSLCIRDNVKVNYNREYWERYFKAKIKIEKT